MRRTIIWRSLRWRVLVAALLVLPLAMLLAGAYRNTVATMPDYVEYLDGAWFELPGANAIFLLATVIISSGRTLFRPRNDLAYLLALPVSRRRWFGAHAAMSIAALATLIILMNLVFVIGALRADHTAPLGALAIRSALTFAAALPWVGVTLGALGLLRRPVLALVLILGLVILLPTGRFRFELPVRPVTTMLPWWDPWAFADPRAWQGRLPLASLFTAVALGVGGALIARYRLQHYEP